MTKIDKISVAITREQHAKIKAAIERGDYASTSEVIRTALREWELREEMRRLEGERIGRLWDEGIASGPAREGSPIMERLRSKYAALAKQGKKRAKRVA
jgi:antitoxin ParD1/3/4